MISNSYKPFDLSRLESVSRDGTRIKEILVDYLPREKTKTQLITTLVQALEQVTHTTCKLYVKDFRIADAEVYKKRVGSSGTYAVISSVPTGAKGLVVCDTMLALAVIEEILGGDLSETPSARPLTEIETGVLSYLFARLFQAFHRFVGEQAVPFRLESICGSGKELPPLFSGSKKVAAIEIKLMLPGLAGVVEVILPDSFIKEVMAPSVTGKKRPDEVNSETLEKLGDLRFPMVASVGKATLTHSEAASIEVGDIVLVDDPWSRIEGDALKGDILLSSVRKGVPSVLAEIERWGARPHVRIKEIYV